MEYLLIGINFEDFFNRKVDPDEFDAALREAIGDDATLEEIGLCVGEGDPHAKQYEYLVTTDQSGLRPRLKGVPGVGEVLVFAAKPVSDPNAA